MALKNLIIGIVFLLLCYSFHNFFWKFNSGEITFPGEGIVAMIIHFILWPFYL